MIGARLAGNDLLRGRIEDVRHDDLSHTPPSENLLQLGDHAVNKLRVSASVPLQPVQQQELLAQKRLERLLDEALAAELQLSVKLVEEPLLRLVIEETPLEEVTKTRHLFGECAKRISVGAAHG
jgi:hypothetical protein